MRVHAEQDGLTVHAIAGSYVVHLGFDVADEKREGLLGFAVRREDQTENERHWALNMRTFPGMEGTKNVWRSNEAPIQKFRWGDYTARPEHKYAYEVSPVYGEPGRLELRAPLRIEVTSENPRQLRHPDGTLHQVHFSRGAGASQAYVRRFGDHRPDEVAGDAAFQWLSRGLLEAMVAFIDAATRGDEFRIVAYEFHHDPILQAVKRAVDRGVEVKILYDAGTGSSGPVEKNQEAIRQAGLTEYSKPREGLKSYISHHKVIVLLRGGEAKAVWTGSTNMSLNGIYAQLNVGHALEDPEVAAAYGELHSEIWENDPSAKDMRTLLGEKYPEVRPAAGKRCTFIFSPRSKEEAMEFYVELMESAKQLVVVTTPFGVDSRIEDYFASSPASVVKFGLTGSEDRYGGDVTRIDSIDGTRYTMPARIDSVLDRWQVEQFQFKSHAYVHTKFLLIDPLGDDPTVVTGSANFSRASCINNDENMLVIQGHRSAVDIYLTEFLRMFEHYAFRHLVEEHRRRGDRLPLDASDGWTQKFFRQGSERERDRKLFSGRDS